MSIVLFNSASVKTARTFGLGLGRHQSDRLPFGPRSAEQAWNSGYELAIDGVEADAPHGMSDFEKDAFTDGHEQGWRENDLDRMAFLESLPADDDDREEEGPSIGFAEELRLAVQANDRDDLCPICGEPSGPESVASGSCYLCDRTREADAMIRQVA